jgi:hypothetical protein
VLILLILGSQASRLHETTEHYFVIAGGTPAFLQKTLLLPFKVYDVTSASVHDSIPCLDLMHPEPLYDGQEFFADSACLGNDQNPIQDDLRERGFSPQISEKGVRNHPLTPFQRFCNRVKSIVRCRVEHVFGEQKKRMGDETLRTIDGQRARFWIGMRNLAANMRRAMCLLK